MDLSTQYQQHHQETSQTSDPSQYDQSAQAYYAYHQFNQYIQQQQYPYYTQDYTGAYQHHRHHQQQSQQEPASIHPPGVPIPPQPTQMAGPEHGSGQTHLQKQQNSYYPQAVVDQQPSQQQQQLNSSDSAAAAAAVSGLSQLTQFAGNMDAAQRAVAGVQEQRWHGNNEGFGPVPMHNGPRPSKWFSHKICAGLKIYEYLTW